MIQAIAQVIGAIVGVIAIAIVFQVPQKHLLHAGLVGGFAWAAYLLALHFGASSILAMFTASIALALISHIMARVVRVPVTLFLIPGIMPLVPGAGMYRIAYSLIYDQSAFSRNLTTTLMTAGAIALGVFIVDAIVRVIQFNKLGK